MHLQHQLWKLLLLLNPHLLWKLLPLWKLLLLLPPLKLLLLLTPLQWTLPRLKLTRLLKLPSLLSKLPSNWPSSRLCPVQG